jgi:dihydroxyacetone kinase-like protein
MVRREHIVRWLEASAAVLAENRDRLTKLDAALGDADHGINMDRGFKKVQAMLDTATSGDIASLLKQTGMTLISSVGGASGPLYGSFFMRAGLAVAGREILETGDLAALFDEGLKGVMERGRAQAGDKTMVDALLPAVHMLKEAAAKGLDAVKAVDGASRQALRGAEETIPMTARKGRASYLGERSRGHQDPGATSSYLIIEALNQVLAAASSPLQKG